MKYYEQLLTLACFTYEDVCKITGNPNTASSVIQAYLKKDYIRSVKRNLYVAVNLVGREPVAGPYLIASRITDSSYVSHHSAFAWYGYANQVSNDMFVSSDKAFAPFSFEGTTYRHLKSRISEGVEVKPDGARVTDIERTILDGLNDFDKVMGLEELLRCLSSIPSADESKLLTYLGIYNKQVLYQKAGYILNHFKQDLNLSDVFFGECARHIGKSIRYLYNSEDKSGFVHDRMWRMMVPKDLMNMTSKGGFEDAEI